MTNDPKPRPRAFRLDEARMTRDADRPPATHDTGRVVIEPQPDAYAAGEPHLSNEEAAVEQAQDRGMMARAGMSWASLFWSALGALVSLAIGVWFETLIEGFFARSAALGWIGLALLAFIGLALLALTAREVLAVARQRHIARLHQSFAQARLADDRDAARSGVRELCALYAGRPATARARANLAGMTREIVDGRDLIDIAERGLMHGLDAEATREIAAAARRVSVVTAISPRALIDVVFVAAQAIHIIRRLAEIYGGRPGFMGFIRLARSVGAHLAITGGMAVGDSLVQQVLGHGIAARLSARLGEGVLNGMLTARIGLSAMAVCRPMPFAVEKPPGVGDVAPFLFSSEKSATSG